MNAQTAKVRQTVTKGRPAVNREMRRTFHQGELVQVYLVNGDFWTSLDPDSAWIFDAAELDINHKMLHDHAVSAARRAIAQGKAEGLPLPSVFLAAAHAAAAIVSDNEAGIIAGRLLGLLDENNMPTNRSDQ